MHTNFSGYVPTFAGLFLLLILTPGCGDQAAPVPEAAPAAASIVRADYGTTTAGEPVESYTLRNAAGMEVTIITYGGIITALTAPDREGKFENVVLGYDSLGQYEASNPYFGALIGRYGNRIAGGNFQLDGETYQLETNDGPNHLHGGVTGFDKVVWEATELPSATDPGLRLTHLSPDGAGGYPGNLSTTVTYTLGEDNRLEVAYEATTDRPTIVNLTQHTYFNLSADPSRDILDHVLSIDAERYLPVDPTLIPTGELEEVAGTPFDFTEPKAIGKEIGQEHEQLRRGKGYDHCWVLDAPGGEAPVATLHHPGSGRRVEVFTDEPGLQFYSGNFLDGTLPAPGGGTYGHRTGLCLETQHFPDSPNQDGFPSVVLRPGEAYATTTTYQFSTK
ncbi:aldose 1-epimerase [Lewinella marina]|uniref:Aldose 1-epimerase n=1 Tax=Neolewinella marina TaxID=438751 RepID=A0A2G0CAZ9_9BACT|nr:aldose epimerase family protein [Neolewinella marina]NJB84273.1 aldose 1-epimerase [Neolewinella marina]PHK97143.1 galactose-1-epimerase [Neolewinella marina]